MPSAASAGSEASSEFTVYSTVWCGYCTRLKGQLRREGISFAEVDIEQDPAAEEIVNDVFLRIWQKRGLLKDVASPELYLLKCARNRSLEFLRSQRSSVRMTEDDDLHDFPVQWELSPEQLLISSEMVKYINKVIDQLAPRCKLIFLLVKESNLKYKEVAELLNISVKTVEAQMSIALKKISLSVPLTFLQH